MEVLFGVFPIPEADRQEEVIRQVLLADRLGLDLVGIQDHPYQRRYLDTWTLLAYLAGRTERVRLFPDVANLPLRHPALLAKAAATLDRLSGGRAELGLGAGAFWEGVGAWGGPVRTGKDSVDALEEAIELIRRVWAAEHGIRFEGVHYRLAGAHGGPPPAHDMGIWLGAYGPRMMRVVGRLADGWIPSLPRLPLEEVPPRQAMIDDAARAAGRDPARIRRVANINGAIEDGPVTAWLHGPVDHWVQELLALVEDLRFDALVLWPDHPGRARADRALRHGGRPRGAVGARRLIAFFFFFLGAHTLYLREPVRWRPDFVVTLTETLNLAPVRFRTVWRSVVAWAWATAGAGAGRPPAGGRRSRSSPGSCRRRRTGCLPRP
jgi:alkanesulfonate monooxygenase SsuD/methylene tetrahydromethanopterin reductase-like flavin-dependent oxidoreductase (luciferase family)